MRGRSATPPDDWPTSAPLPVGEQQSPSGRPKAIEHRRRSFDKTSKVRRLLNLGLLDLAQSLAEEMLAEDDGNADAHSLIANILDRRNDWDASLAHLRRACELMPDGPQVQLNLGMALLRLGNYREGLSLYEARLDKPAWSGFATADSRAANRGRLLRPGEPVDQRRILLLAEQGLGDGIMCARYIPLLAKRGAQIVVASNPTLRPFFARMDGSETLLSPPPDQPFAQINLAALPFDAWLPLLSLPYWFGTDLSNVPADIPYWTADATRIAAWRARFAEAGRIGTPKVGLVFQANPGGPGFSDKSMQIPDLVPLCSLDGVDVVNLQYGPAGRALAAAAPGIIDPSAGDLPLDEYGAALAATDLLITVDTMAAHFSGALGGPTWVVVPHSPHWMWGLTGATTPWYPTARIFRQQKNRDWSSAMATIAAEITANVASLERAAVNVGETKNGQELVTTATERVQQSDRPNSLLRQNSMAPSAPATLELALAQLRHGEYDQGFANYEARQDIALWSEQALPLPESLIAVAERRLQPSDPIRGRRIAVFTEQGLGDVFFGARFLDVLAERGASITLICRAPMRPFFARLAFLDTILSPPEDAPHAKIDLRRLSFDAFCPLLSLPHVLRLARAVTQLRVPYLSADPTQIAAWRARYERHGRPGWRKVGIVWQANPNNRALANRSMLAKDLAPLAKLEDVDLVNLQYGSAGRELARIAPEAIDPMQMQLTLDEFAAAAAATDIMVSVDTMAAHCSGALGHPLMVVLPDEPACWWGRERSDCDWYPGARLFRRSAGADWSETIEAVAATLRAEKRHTGRKGR